MGASANIFYHALGPFRKSEMMRRQLVFVRESFNSDFLSKKQSVGCNGMLVITELVRSGTLCKFHGREKRIVELISMALVKIFF